MPNDIISNLANMPAWALVVLGGGGTLAAPYAKEFVTALIRRWEDSAKLRESSEQARATAEVTADASLAVVREQETTKRVDQLFAALAAKEKIIEELHTQIDRAEKEKAISDLECERKLNVLRLELRDIQHTLDNTRLGIERFVTEEFERARDKNSCAPSEVGDDEPDK